MIDFVTWSLLVVGLTYAATMSFIFALPRMLISRLGTVPRYFVYCPMCMSFWFGALTYPFYTNEAPWTVSYFGNVVAAGFVAMGLVSVLKGFMPESPWGAEQGRSEEEVTVGEPEGKPACPHRYADVGPDRRCILCGADEERG